MTRTLPTGADVTPAPETDLLGRTLTADEHAVLGVYTALRDALARDDLSPCAAANLRAALAPVAVAVTDLGLRFEHLTDDAV